MDRGLSPKSEEYLFTPAQISERMIQHHLAPDSSVSLEAREVVTEWSVLG